MLPKIHQISEEEIAQSAEFILAGKRAHLPKSIQEHLIECYQSAAEVVSVMEYIEEEGIEINQIVNK